MEEPFEESYFNWLCAKVNRVEFSTPSLTYRKLLRILHNTEFVWLLSGDDNRAGDGVDLRQRFLIESRLEADPDWFNLGCSLLEMLIAFSERAEFQTDESAYTWFWLFLTNLGLSGYNDATYVSESGVNAILDNFIWRTYSSDGSGGLFPLRRPEHDQREVEIWYQFCEYLVDQERL